MGHFLCNGLPRFGGTKTLRSLSSLTMGFAETPYSLPMFRKGMSARCLAMISAACSSVKTTLCGWGLFGFKRFTTEASQSKYLAMRFAPIPSFHILRINRRWSGVKRLFSIRPLFDASCMFSFIVPRNKWSGLTQRGLSHLWQTWRNFGTALPVVSSYIIRCAKRVWDSCFALNHPYPLLFKLPIQSQQFSVRNMLAKKSSIVFLRMAITDGLKVPSVYTMQCLMAKEV